MSVGGFIGVSSLSPAAMPTALASPPEYIGKIAGFRMLGASSASPAFSSSTSTHTLVMAECSHAAGGSAVDTTASYAATVGTKATEVLVIETSLPVCSASNAEPVAAFSTKSSR
ncbi:hypothetical protein PF002_g33389, partial [Phytophthora fragariae]